MSDDTSAPNSGLPPQPHEPPTVIPPRPGPPPVPPSQPPEQDGLDSTQSIARPPGYPPPPGYVPLPVPPPPASPPPASPPPVLPPVPPPPRAGRRRPPLWALIAGGVALAGLVAGLLVWAPWSPPPQAPTAVRVTSPTATTVLISWTAPKGGAQPSQYDIMRDGREQGIVPGSQTSWTDTGLAPGSRHSYTVITEGNGQKSPPSAEVSVVTITPPPAGVTVAGENYTTVTLHWSPPPNAPAPDAYTIYDTSTGKDLLDTLSGSQTSYTVTGLVPGDGYSFAVGASWGSVDSAPSAVNATPLSPPLSGSVPVNLKVTHILAGSTGMTVGETWTDNWTFTASCQTSTCTLTDKGNLAPGVGQFTAKLKPESGGYEGQAAHVQFSHCGGVDSYETFIVRLKPDSGGVSNGAWTSWYGTLTLAATTQYVAAGSCAGGDWVLDLTSA